MNEHGQIVLSVMCPLESMKEGACRIALDALANNFDRRGIKVQLTASDKPDNDQVLRVVFGVPAKGSFKFYGTKLIVKASNTVDVDAGVARLREAINDDIQPGERPLCCLDTEWPSTELADRSVALIQVGNPKFSLLVRVRIGTWRAAVLPKSLCTLLNDPNIDKVFRHLNKFD